MATTTQNEKEQLIPEEIKLEFFLDIDQITQNSSPPTASISSYWDFLKENTSTQLINILKEVGPLLSSPDKLSFTRKTRVAGCATLFDDTHGLFVRACSEFIEEGTVRKGIRQRV